VNDFVAKKNGEKNWVLSRSGVQFEHQREVDGKWHPGPSCYTGQAEREGPDEDVTADYTGLHYLMKMRRRQLVEAFDQDDDPNSARLLANTHNAILAIEAVQAESEFNETRGPIITFDEKGWPIDPH